MRQHDLLAMVDRGPVLRVPGCAVSNFFTVGGRYRTCTWMQAPPGEQKLQPGNAALRWRLDHKRSISSPHPPPPGPRAEAGSTPGPGNTGDFTKLSFLGSSWLVQGNPCGRGVVGTCPRMKFSFQPLSFSSEPLLAGGLSEATQKAQKNKKKSLFFLPPQWRNTNISWSCSGSLLANLCLTAPTSPSSRGGSPRQCQRGEAWLCRSSGPLPAPRPKNTALQNQKDLWRGKKKSLK